MSTRTTKSVCDILNFGLPNVNPQASCRRAKPVVLETLTVPETVPPQTLHFLLDNSEWCLAEGNEPTVEKRPRGAGLVVTINHSMHHRYRLKLVGSSQKDFPYWQKDVFFMAGNDQDECEIRRDDKGYFVLFKRRDVGGYIAKRRDGDQVHTLKMLYSSGRTHTHISMILTKPHCNCSKKRKRLP